MVLTPDQKSLQDTARRFAREQLSPMYLKREKIDRLERDVVQEMGRLGLIGLDFPEAHGGMAVDGVTTGLIAEEIAYGDFNLSSIPVGASLNGAILLRHANEELVAQWIPKMLRGDAVVGICLTEPRGGSDAANLQLRAKRDGTDYILSGEKASITFAGCADAFIVFARTGTREAGAHGVSAFFVPGNLPGVRRLRYDDVGGRLLERGSVFLDDVRIPQSYRLGEEGKGFTQVMQGFDYSRALIALQCVGSAQASLDEAWAYTQERQAFGRAIAQFQGVTFPLAEGESILSAIRQLSLHALALRDAGLPHTSEAAMCKWMGPKHAFEVIHQSLLTMGHYGWTKDTAHQQRMRDVMGLEIGDGTAAVMKLIIARQKVGKVAVQYL
jgi:cyclohexanecarboxyl-CoA dehydrogenase